MVKYWAGKPVLQGIAARYENPCRVPVDTTPFESTFAMTEDQLAAKASGDESVLQAQYLRSLSSFEGIVLSQIKMKNQLSNRLNWTIRAGLILLGVIAFSILVLLLTLSSQINRISGVVVDINQHFDAITLRMDRVSTTMGSMEAQISLMGAIDANTAVMDEKMASISQYMSGMRGNLDGIAQQLTLVRDEIGNISGTVGNMNREVGVMALEMHEMSKPARTMNRMFPIP